MTPSDYPAFVEAWSQVAEVYGKAPSDGAMNLIFNSLRRYDLNAIKQALTAHVNDTQHGDFLPKPADIVRHIEGDGDTRALSAWAKVEDAIRRVGPYETVVFDDPRTMAAIEEMGGWIKLCDVTDRDLPFKGNEFKKRYQGYISRPPERHPSKLLGMSEATNAGEHQEFVPEPRLVGNPQQCLAVMKQGAEAQPGINRLSDALDGAAKQLTSKSEVA